MNAITFLEQFYSHRYHTIGSVYEECCMKSVVQTGEAKSWLG